MPEPVPSPMPNSQDSTSTPSTGTINFYTQDLNQLKQSVEKFKATGQVDPGELDFAKKEILPKIGLKSEEIDDLGPVGVMVRLQNEIEKGSLGDLGNKPNTEEKDSTVNVETSTPKPNGTLPPKQGAEASLPETLTNSDIKELTQNLSSEIDQEIKRQIAEKHALDLAQEKIDKVLSSDESKPLEQPVVEEKIQPVPAAIPNEKKIEVRTEPSPIPDEIVASLDPLAQSVEHALKNLKEGSKVGSEWELKKILTTSFGNNKSPFYELENQEGAKWTLSPEEMKDALRSQILADQKEKEIKDEKPTLGVSKIQHPALHPIEAKKLVSNVITKPLEQIIKTVRKENPPKLPIEDKTGIKKIKIDLPETKHHEDKPIVIAEKPLEKQVVNKPPLHQTEEHKSNVTIESTNLSQKQIDFIAKVHSDKDSWRAFTSFNAEQWGNVNQLYKDGKLIDLGIDAHPLIDKLTDPEFTETIDIRKGDTFSKILEDAGYNLSYTADDSKIIGSHLIANHQFLIEASKKAEVSGFTTSNVPTDKEIIDLIHAAQNGNHEAFYQLQEPFHQLPVNGKFRVVKPNNLEELKSFFRK